MKIVHREQDSAAAIQRRGEVCVVRTFPDPILKEVCRSVEQFDAKAVELLDDLLETMFSLPRCVGLAAPQIGIPLRAIVVDISRNPKIYDRGHGLLCMVNPLIRFSAGSTLSREGCASVPEFTANVRRAANVAVSYIDYVGAEKVLEAGGFEAIALQHEIDHLDGKLFLDRVNASDVFRRQTPRARREAR